MSARRESLPLQVRAVAVEPATFDAERNTVRVVWATGVRVRRVDMWTGDAYEEELVLTPEAVDMSRFEAGAVQVLDGHDRFSGVRSILGIAESAAIERGQGVAVLRLSQRPELAGVVGDIRAGIIRDISAGYSVERYEVTRAQDRTDGVPVPLWRAVRWTPHEISFVGVPADPNAGTRAAPVTFPCEFAPVSLSHLEQTMPEAVAPTQAQTQERAAEITALCTRHQVPDLAAELIRGGSSIEAAGLAILNRRAEQDLAAGGHLNTRRGQATYPAAVAFGSGDTGETRELMAEALAARMGGPALTRENPYHHARVPDMARDCLELRGVRTSSMSAGQLIERALHGTADFPELLTGAGDRVLRQAYQVYSGGVKRAFKPTTAKDFRAKQRLALGEAPALLQVNEAGEFKSGSMAETKSTYSLATYGRIFGITRQALINDDLDAFGDAAMRLGRAAAEFEAQFLVNLLTSNPAMYDTVALFHASHGNLGTGVGSALSETSLSAARTAMRLQKGLDGKTPIDASPKYLIVPAALETAGEKLLAQLAPTVSTQVNPFSGKLDLVVDPRLDVVSATKWYLASDPGLVDTIEYAYLESAGGPEVFAEPGFEIDGVRLKVRLDFGGGVMDWRGLYRGDGA